MDPGAGGVGAQRGFLVGAAFIRLRYIKGLRARCRLPMPLPGLDRAEISPAKLRDYLLNLRHPVGRAKARYFLSLGFRRNRWYELRNALLVHAAHGTVLALPPGPFGQRYLVRGTIQGPAGAAGRVLAVWIVAEASAPRLITAYPEDTP